MSYGGGSYAGGGGSYGGASYAKAGGGGSYGGGGYGAGSVSSGGYGGGRGGGRGASYGAASGGGYGGGRGGGYGQARGRGRGRGGFGRGRGGGGGGRSRKFDPRKIFVGGVSKRDTDSNSFQQFFQKFGELEDIILMTAQDGTEGHRGFGFVTFKDQAVTDIVLSKAGHLDLDGRMVDVKMALPPDLKPPEGVEGNKLFVGSLPKEGFSSEDLKEYFGQWGAVTDSWVSQGKGFGFVTYENSTGAYKALMHGLSSGHSVREGIQLDAKWPRARETGGGRGGGTAGVYQPQIGYGGGGASGYAGGGGAYSGGGAVYSSGAASYSVGGAVGGAYSGGGGTYSAGGYTTGVVTAGYQRGGGGAGGYEGGGGGSYAAGGGAGGQRYQPY